MRRSNPRAGGPRNGGAQGHCGGGSRQRRGPRAAAEGRAVAEGRRKGPCTAAKEGRGGAGGRARWRVAAAKDHKREGSRVAEEKEKERRCGDGRENNSPNTEGVGSILEVKG
jgi:hypothetical protein